ncbi:hypothetical protein IX27_02860 [Streptomyces sp. JS01]|uniref:hypothetical protein n=1 Tax=Streptomyces sp. JS01 TaxID=1525753 RepID=UPI00050554BA|nr:hypothetical protein [Streptomyces sp. JS01]KFK89989.1 hypothetical protein IX27_02860 [Streptomyces sp. JS01]
MTSALLALVGALALVLVAALVGSLRLGGRLDREARALVRRPCPIHCTACSSAARRASNGDTPA